MKTESEDREPLEQRERLGLERHLAVFVEESSLWPVLLVAVLIFTTIGAALLTLAMADRNVFAIGALLILLWLSVDILARRRRFGLAGGVIVALWTLSGLAALGFHRLGLF